MRRVASKERQSLVLSQSAVTLWTVPSVSRVLRPAKVTVDRHAVMGSFARLVPFNHDRAALVAALNRFCDQLPQPVLQHPIFGPLTEGDWWRWGYLPADHHLRQLGH